LLVPNQGKSRELLCLFHGALVPEMLKYIYTCISTNIMSKLPSRATILTSRSVERLSVENVHSSKPFKILICMPLISIIDDFRFIISHSVPSVLYSNSSIILNEILPYHRICSVRGFIILHPFINMFYSIQLPINRCT